MKPKSIAKLMMGLSIQKIVLFIEVTGAVMEAVLLSVRNTIRFKPQEDLPNKSLELISIEFKFVHYQSFVHTTQ